MIPPRLTDRELEVVRLLALGHSAKEVGSLLGISDKTVSTHRSQVFRLTGCRNVVRLAHLAIRNRWIELI